MSETNDENKVINNEETVKTESTTKDVTENQTEEDSKTKSTPKLFIDTQNVSSSKQTASSNNTPINTPNGVETSPRSSVTSPNATSPLTSSSNSTTPTSSNKKKYDSDFLLGFRTEPECQDKPEGLTNFPMDIILANSENNNQFNRNNKMPQSPHAGRNSPKPSGKRGQLSQSTNSMKPSNSGHRKSNSIGGSTGGMSRSFSGNYQGKGRGGNPMSKVDIANLPPVAPLVVSENRWVRTDTATQDEVEGILRNAQGILNKLTIEHFDSLSDKIKELITTQDLLVGVIDLIFAKALKEAHFSTMYADLCLKLSKQVPNFDEKENFRRLLLTKCQQEFERSSKGNLVIPEELPQEEKEFLEIKFKKMALGNIRFIGELFKKGILPERIMHACIKSLLTDLENPIEEEVESLCKLITTIGKMIDVPKYNDQMEDYFNTLNGIATNMNASSRTRFMARDLVDLRSNAWVPRRKENEAKSLAAARAEVTQAESPVNSPKVGLRRSESKEVVSQDFRSAVQDYKESHGRGDLRSSRDQVKKSSITRSVSENNIHQEWDSPTQSRSGRGGRGRDDKRSQNQDSGWEVVGGGRSNLKSSRGFGRGSGVNPSPERGIPKSRSEVYKEKEPASRPKNSFSVLANEDSTPKSALRRSQSRDSPSNRKGVQIQEPEEDKQSNAHVEKKTELFIEEYISSADFEEALQCLTDLNAKSLHNVVVSKAINMVIEKKQKDKEEIIKLFSLFHDEGVITVEELEKGFRESLENIDDVDIDTPYASTDVAKFMAAMMSFDITPLSIAVLEKNMLTHLTHNGKAVQFISKVLNELTTLKGEDFVGKACQKTNFKITPFFQESKRDPEQVTQFLKEKNLSYLDDLIIGMKSTPTVVINKMEDKEQFDAIQDVQHFDGYWPLDSEFLEILFGTNESGEPSVSMKDVIASIPQSLKENEEDVKTQNTIWATILATKYLELNLPHMREKWEKFTKKTQTWLASELDEIGSTFIDELNEKAISFLKSQSGDSLSASRLNESMK